VIRRRHSAVVFTRNPIGKKNEENRYALKKKKKTPGPVRFRADERCTYYRLPDTRGGVKINPNDGGRRVRTGRRVACVGAETRRAAEEPERQTNGFSRCVSPKAIFHGLIHARALASARFYTRVSYRTPYTAIHHLKRSASTLTAAALSPMRFRPFPLPSGTYCFARLSPQRFPRRRPSHDCRYGAIFRNRLQTGRSLSRPCRHVTHGYGTQSSLRVESVDFQTLIETTCFDYRWFSPTNVSRTNIFSVRVTSRHHQMELSRNAHAPPVGPPAWNSTRETTRNYADVRT